MTPARTPHRRPAIWLREVSRDVMSQRLKDSMGALLSIFDVSRHAQEIELLLAGKPTAPAQSHRPDLRVSDGVIRRLLDLSPELFEQFVTELLSTLGFECTRTDFVGDKGVDVIGTLNAEGVASVNLHVQVKRYRSATIGIGEVQKIRGTLGADEHGAIVTTSTFTKQAQQEAQESGKKPIALIDKGNLVDLILKHFGELSPEHQAFLQLQRKEVPLEDQFVFAVGSTS
jgi:predicted Mrr-cat superfamily restriction endonuclease